MLRVGSKKVAIITGITGQTGSFLADLLLSKCYDVHGVVRNHAELGQAAHLRHRVHWHRLCIENAEEVSELIRRVEPDEYYNLAAISFIPKSIEHPVDSFKVTGMATIYALEAIRTSGADVRFFQAGSSEIFGKVHQSPQNEETPLRPMNPYASAKVLAHNAVQNYRQHYGLYACNAILYNHESPRRGLEFVTRKITSTVARIACGLQSHLVLGSLDASRDWGYAGDFVDAIWRMLQQPQPDDYVIGTGQLTTLQSLIEIAFDAVGMRWEDKVLIDPKFVRPPEPIPRVADITRARTQMGWTPSTALETWFYEMIEHDLRLARAEAGTVRKAA